MKNLVEKLIINKNTTANNNNSILAELQNNYEKDIGSQLFSWKDSSDKYKFGFAAANRNDETLKIIAYNPDENNTEQDALFWDYDFDIEQVEQLGVGGCIRNRTAFIIRIW